MRKSQMFHKIFKSWNDFVSHVLYTATGPVTTFLLSTFQSLALMCRMKKTKMNVCRDQNKVGNHWSKCFFTY